VPRLLKNLELVDQIENLACITDLHAQDLTDEVDSLCSPLILLPN